MVFKEQLSKEIAQVEMILQLAGDRATLDAANDLSMNFMMTQKTCVISSIEVSNYLGFIGDKIRHEKNGDLEAAEGSQENIDDGLVEIQKELAEARAQLNSL